MFGVFFSFLNLDFIFIFGSPNSKIGKCELFTPFVFFKLSLISRIRGVKPPSSVQARVDSDYFAIYYLGNFFS